MEGKGSEPLTRGGKGRHEILGQEDYIAIDMQGGDEMATTERPRARRENSLRG